MKKNTKYLTTTITLVSIICFASGTLFGGAISYKILQMRGISAHKATTYTIGYKDGKHQAKEEKREAWKDAKKFYRKTVPYNKSEKVVFTGSLNHSGYNFYFKENLSVYGTRYAGYSFPLNSTILIDAGQFGERTEVICNHEVLHQLFPTYVHPKNPRESSDALYFLQDKVDLKMCDSLVRKVQSLQDS